MKLFKIFFLFNLFLMISWSETPSKGMSIKALHFNEVRNVINIKRQCAGLAQFNFSDPSLVAQVTPIKKIHFQEIINSSQEIANTCSISTGPLTSCSVDSTLKNQVLAMNPSQQISAQGLLVIMQFLDTVVCNSLTYNWQVGNYSSCSGGVGNWYYGNWNSCSGETQTTSYTNWSSCNSGSQTRNKTITNLANTGTQTRVSTCNFTVNSGTQTRSVQCVRNDGVIVADSFCTSPKPASTNSCTPTNSTVCGPVNSTQNCPATDVVASVTTESQSCSNTLPVNGGWSSWSWGACTGATCPGKTGTQTGTRTCDNPSPANGGAGCVGSSTTTQACIDTTLNCANTDWFFMGFASCGGPPVGGVDYGSNPPSGSCTVGDIVYSCYNDFGGLCNLDQRCDGYECRSK